MRKQFTGSVFTMLALATVLVSIFGASFAFAKGQNHSIAHAQFATSAKPAIAPMVSMHTADMRGVPAETASSVKLSARTMPFLTGVSTAVYAQRKAAALHTKNAPLNVHPAQDSPYTPLTLAKFKGMADSSRFVLHLVVRHLTRRLPLPRAGC